MPSSADNLSYDSLAFQTSAAYDLDTGAVSTTQERHMTASPMTFDGRYLYAISTTRNKDTPKKVEQYVLETYELDWEIRELIRVKNVVLKAPRNDATIFEEWQKLKTLQAEGGLLNHCNLACNGEILIL